MSETNTPQNEQLEATPLPQHVQEFISLSEGLEAAIQTKNPIDITMARNKLKLLFVSMDETKRLDIENFIKREMAGVRIQDERNKVVGGIHRILNAPVIGMRALAATVPQFTGATLDLIVTTLGLGLHGIWRGAKKTYQTFTTAA